MTIRVEPGDCLEVMARLIAEGVVVQSIVTDPPYHLTSIVKRFGAEDAAPAKSGKTGAYARAARGFMGKQWDGGDIAFQAATWRLCFELPPPGGHLIAFSGTRTYHRMACAIEDAGFEIRDSILDMMSSDEPIRLFLDSLSQEQAAAFFKCIEESQFGGLLAWIYGTGFPKSHDVSKAIDKAAGAQREVVATEKVRDIRNGHGRGVGDGINAAARGAPVYMEREITAAATAAAKEWEGWGTALKPAWEPMVLARKPLIGSVAENVLKHGTGAINVDGCRVGESGARNNGRKVDSDIYGKLGPFERVEYDKGRFPANVVHDGSEEVLAAFPDAPGQLADASTKSDRRKTQNVYGAMRGGRAGEPSADSDNCGVVGFKPKPGARRLDAGSAARFFYSAKADAGDRVGSRHPTVKPVDLMAWLVRLVTPPGGTVLDPFAGTGTTGIAALREGFNAILIEREPEYLGDIAARIALATDPDAGHSLSVKGRHRDKEEAAGKGMPLFGGAS